MDRYKMIKGVGEGTFGCVWKALNVETGEIVAIKKMKKKYYSWEECLNLREVKSLSKMNHPNVMKLKEVVRENDILYFAFEYMDCNLYELMKDRRTQFSESEVRTWCYQMFQGLAYMHHRGYFHRDLKPENLLVSKGMLKIADFGLAREIASEPPYTDYVSTRWYRAPEVMLQSFTYGPAVDMWAMGAIMAELFTLHPLFPGSCEADEISKICAVIGSPDLDWPEGVALAKKLNYQFPQCSGVPLSKLIPSASRDAIDLIKLLCTWDPSKRPSASEVLQHPFFQCCYYVPPSLRSRAPTGTPQLSYGHVGSTDLENPSKRWEQPVPIRNTAPLKPPAAVLQKPNTKTKEEFFNAKSFKDTSEQSKYNPPPRVYVGFLKKRVYVVPAPSKPRANGQMASDTIDKLANNRHLGPDRQYQKNHRPPPLVKWHQNGHLGRTYARKAAG